MTLQTVGCAVRFRFEAKRSENEAKNFSLRSEKLLFFRLFRFERKTGNHKRNENERSEISKAKRKITEKSKLKKCRRRT
jgi:hypothetical protein